MKQVGVKPYTTSLEYIFDELKILELYLGLAVIKFREETKVKQPNEFSSITYISDEEIDSTIQHTFDKNIDNSEYERLYKIIENQKEVIDKRKEESISKGITLSFKHICDVLQLNEFEKYVILFCMAPEIDLKFEKLYAYLQNDITKKKPTIGLILDLLYDSINEKISYRRFLSTNSTLARLHIINFEQNNKDQSLLSIPLNIDSHIVNFILGLEKLNPILKPVSQLLLPNDMNEDNYSQIHEKIEKNLIEHITKNDFTKNGITFYLKGPTGVGKKTTTKFVCNKIFSSVLIVDVKNAMKIGIDANDLFILIFREASILNTTIYLDNFDFLFNSHDNTNNKKTVNIEEFILKEITRH
ncbi:MAG: AAA family ATPase, partial [Nitrosopumilus sp.]|nr:AAA family ATPase [Nitrosopumilus sp.]